jgi:hypothetical protein
MVAAWGKALRRLVEAHPDGDPSFLVLVSDGLAHPIGTVET